MVSADGCDGHTGAFVWGTGTYPVDSLPFRLWLFEDEVVIVDALPPYEDLIDTRIDTVEGRPIGEVLAALDPLIPRDNAQTVRLLTPRYLLIPQVLRGLGIAGDGPVALGLTLADGRRGRPPDRARADGRVQRLGRAVRPASARRPGRPVPVEHRRRPVVAGPARVPGRCTSSTTASSPRRRRRWTSSASRSATRRSSASCSTSGTTSAARSRPLDPIETLFAGFAARPARAGCSSSPAGTRSRRASLLVARLDAAHGRDVRRRGDGRCPTSWGDSSELDLPYSGIVVSVAADARASGSTGTTRATPSSRTSSRRSRARPGATASIPRSSTSSSTSRSVPAVASRPDPLETSLLFDVFALNQAVGRMLADAMRDGPLTPSEYAVYSAIFELEAASPTELAARLGMRLTTFIDQLRLVEARGHARRIPTRPIGAPIASSSLRRLGLAAHRAAAAALRGARPSDSAAAKLGAGRPWSSARDAVESSARLAGGGSPARAGQPPPARRSRRLNSASASRQASASRWAWRAIQGSTRLESSIATVTPLGPSSMTMPVWFR